MLRNGTRIRRIRRIYSDFYFFVMPVFSIELTYFFKMKALFVKIRRIRLIRVPLRNIS